MKRHAQILAGTLWCAAFAAIPAPASSILIYISPPGVENSKVGGATVENFNSMTPGNRTTSYTSLIGTYNATPNSPFDIIAADPYGGAGNSSDTKYFAIGAQSNSSAPVSLALRQSADYFGFWWSAIDMYNGVSFFNGDSLLTRFSSQTLLTFLQVHGQPYNPTNPESSYFGNPNEPFGRNTGEPYVFVNFVAQGIKFDRVVFDNSGTTGTGFESDNHTVSANAVTMSGDYVRVGEYQVETPEPGAASLLAGGLLLIAVARRRGLGAPRPR